MSEVGSRVGLTMRAAGVFAVLAAAAMWIDLPLARWFHEQRLPGDAQRLVRLAEVFGWGGTVAFIIATAATLDPRGWRIAPRLAVGSPSRRRLSSKRPTRNTSARTGCSRYLSSWRAAPIKHRHRWCREPLSCKPR